MSIVWGFIITAIGVVITAKANWFLENFGRIDAAEKYLQFYGGTRLAYQLIGLVICIIGMLKITGLGGGMATDFASSLFGYR
jgi:hypothetical protein